MKSKLSRYRTLRIGVSAGILLGGLALASLFPREGGREPDGNPPGSPIVYRRQSGGATGEPTFPADHAPPVEAVLKANPFAANRQATVLRPVAEEPPLPTLTKSFPRDSMGASPRWGISMGIGLTSASAAEVRTHRIVDGDTLPDLAQRYLGDKSRAMEIFEANRHILPSPEILPIGQEIQIPAPVRPAWASSEDRLPEGSGPKAGPTAPAGPRAPSRKALPFGAGGASNAIPAAAPIAAP